MTAKKVKVGVALAVFAQRQHAARRNTQRPCLAPWPQTGDHMRISSRQQQEIAGTQGDLATGAETNKTISAKDEVERQRAGRRRLMIDRECALQATADVERWLQAGKFDKAA
jgi:hypothetical protein